ncbi:TPA: glycogen debranching protein, partial [Candidatus Bathyarchaeota archaeon]|nr:glycogen debranching protein [Candidatus Bathyarchaeota archaeon]
TNGLGGYASSTILNINTRKFHGLLFVAFNPPIDRHLLLSKIDEEIQIGNDRFPLNSNEFRDVMYPEGFRNLKGFALHPFPTFHYQVSGVHVRKEIFMPYLKNMVVINYEVFNALDESAALNLYPLVNMRHFYETTNKDDLQFSQKQISNGVMLESHPKESCLALISPDGNYIPDRNVWIERIYFRIDDSRGENCLDDNYQPGFFKIDLAPRKVSKFHVVAIGGKRREEVAIYSEASKSQFIKKLYVEEINRREGLLKRFYEEKMKIRREDWLNWLILSADSFIVKRKSTGKKSIIAGYHWFEDWGRDSLIAIPGLTLVTGRFRDAEEILLNFKQYCKRGLIPNRFPDKNGDEPVYDSVDATLWFFNAVLQYLKYTGNFDFVHKELWDTLQEIIERHIYGTMFNIHMDDDGLLLHGSRLTWMDASVNGKPVTPREGKAVEIQALWYNALRVMETLSLKFGDENQSQKYRLIAEKTKKSFNEKFWYSKGDYLFDVVTEEKSDSSLRPNQIIATYLDFCILDSQRRERMINVVWRELWGTYGLKSLSSDNLNYIGRCIGNFASRDTAYHNGTVWTWLLGPFVTAFLKAKQHKTYWRRFAFENFLQPLFYEENRRAGLGTLSEIFDGDPPHFPRGCISQAWSVAEPLRAYVEDVLLHRPTWE